VEAVLQVEELRKAYGSVVAVAGISFTVREGEILGMVGPNGVVSMVIFYPMLFLSGAAIPLEIMPATIKKVASFLPLTYVVKLLRGLWFGDSWGEHLLETAVLGGILVFGAALAARFFRWE
jgi:ABC-2 type transport system permease protein